MYPHAEAAARLFLLLATATDRELARQVEYLKAEKRILRAKPPRRIDVTPRERQRLVRLGTAVGAALKYLMSIVSPRTFLRWVNAEESPCRKRATAGQPGQYRPPCSARSRFQWR